MKMHVCELLEKIKAEYSVCPDLSDPLADA
jgi:hypothetical protein